jgi:hypothetical protein
MFVRLAACRPLNSIELVRYVFLLKDGCLNSHKEKNFDKPTFNGAVVASHFRISYCSYVNTCISERKVLGN